MMLCCPCNRIVPLSARHACALLAVARSGLGDDRLVVCQGVRIADVGAGHLRDRGPMAGTRSVPGARHACTCSGVFHPARFWSITVVAASAKVGIPVGAREWVAARAGDLATACSRASASETRATAPRPSAGRG